MLPPPSVPRVLSQSVLPPLSAMLQCVNDGVAKETQTSDLIHSVSVTTLMLPQRIQFVSIGLSPMMSIPPALYRARFPLNVQLVNMGLSEDRSYIPGIGKVPVLGALFGNKMKTRARKEMLVFITPTILSRVQPRAVSSSVSRGE